MNGIGIDVSKRQLDVGTTDGQTLQVSNSRSGFAELDLWLRKRPAGQIVLEATGGYEQSVLDFLHSVGHPVVRANALRARRLAQGMGQMAKTDRLDAYALAQMAAWPGETAVLSAIGTLAAEDAGICAGTPTGDAHADRSAAAAANGD